MARLEADYNPDEVEPGDFDNFTGPRRAAIVESEEKENNNGTGRLLVLKWQVSEGQENANRIVFQNISYLHEKAQTQMIGQQQLKAICDAVGHQGHLEDTEVLHNVECLVTFGLSKTTPEYPTPKTEVKSVKPANAEAPQDKPQQRTAAPSKPAPAANKPAGGGSAPWKKKSAA